MIPGGSKEEEVFKCTILLSHSIEERREEKEGRRKADDEPDASSSLNLKDAMEAYKRAAPQLLNDLARLLSQRKWSEERRIPHGTVNILNYSWHELTAGALTDKPPKSAGSRKLQQTARQVSAGAREEAAETNSCAAGSAGVTERKPQLTPRVKTSEQSSSRGKKKEKKEEEYQATFLWKTLYAMKRNTLEMNYQKIHPLSYCKCPFYD